MTPRSLTRTALALAGILVVLFWAVWLTAEGEATRQGKYERCLAAEGTNCARYAPDRNP